MLAGLDICNMVAPVHAGMGGCLYEFTSQTRRPSIESA